MRAAQRDFARRALADFVVRKGQERAAAEVSVAKAEIAARDSDSAVRSAYEAWDQARSSFESTCAIEVDGHADLTRQAADLRAQVDRSIATAENGQTVDTNAIVQALRQLDVVTRSLGDLERKAIYDQPQPDVQQAHQAVTAAYETYRKVLSANAAYKGESKKQAAVLAEYTNLVVRQGEMSSEN